jgi:hypothetical protein
MRTPHDPRVVCRAYVSAARRHAPRGASATRITRMWDWLVGRPRRPPPPRSLRRIASVPPAYKSASPHGRRSFLLPLPKFHGRRHGRPPLAPSQPYPRLLLAPMFPCETFPAAHASSGCTDAGQWTARRELPCSLAANARSGLLRPELRCQSNQARCTRNPRVYVLDLILCRSLN